MSQTRILCEKCGFPQIYCTCSSQVNEIVRRECLLRLAEIKAHLEMAIEDVVANEFSKSKPHMAKVDEYSFKAQLDIVELSA